MAEEKLIEAIKKHRELYDIKHSDYQKTKLKTRIWSEIAKEVNLKNGEEAKNLWCKLRTGYRDALRRQKKYLKMGVNQNNIKQWRFQQQMSFMEKFKSSRQLDEDSDYESSQLLFTTPPVVEILLSEEDEANTSQENEDEDNKISVSNKRIVRNSAKAQGGESSKQQVLEQRISEENNENDDPLHYFFMYIYHLCKNMPFQQQHTVRSKVFHIVSQVEKDSLESTKRLPSFPQTPTAPSSSISAPSSSKTTHDSFHSWFFQQEK